MARSKKIRKRRKAEERTRNWIQTRIDMQKPITYRFASRLVAHYAREVGISQQTAWRDLESWGIRSIMIVDPTHPDFPRRDNWFRGTAMWMWDRRNLRPNPISDKRRALLKPMVERFIAKKAVSGGYDNPEYRAGIPSMANRILSQIAEADPTPSGKYAAWLLKLFKNGAISLKEDVPKLFELLTRFSEIGPHLPEELRDIHNYATDSELYRTLEEHDETQGKRAQIRLSEQRGAEHIMRYDPLDYEVFKITTPEAAAKWLRDTHWCVKDPKYSKEYLAEGPLYLIAQEDEGYYHRLVLFHYGRKKGVSIMDDADDPVFGEQLEEISPILREVEPATICKECNKLGASGHCTQCERTSACPECLIRCRCKEIVSVTCCGNQCPHCSTVVCNDCGDLCASDGCREFACHHCMYDCEVCSNRICRSCIRRCEKCEKLSCDNCLESCTVCGVWTCTGNCSIECMGCEMRSCLECSSTCEMCAAERCHQCLTGCHYCGTSICTDDGDCTHYCEVCEQENICTRCMSAQELVCSRCEEEQKRDYF